MKKQIITTLAGVAMVGLVQAGIITVANPSFEAQVLADGFNTSPTHATDGGYAIPTTPAGDGTITSWTESNAADHLGYVLNPADGLPQATDGNNVAWIQNNTISQNLTGLSISNGDTITVTFDVWSQNAGNGSTLLVNFAGLGTQAASGVNLNGPAVGQSITFTATSDLTTADLSFRSTAGGNRYLLDNIVVIPEPATLSMIALFGGGLLVIRRKLMM